MITQQEIVKLTTIVKSKNKMIKEAMGHIKDMSNQIRDISNMVYLDVAKKDYEINEIMEKLYKKADIYEQ